MTSTRTPRIVILSTILALLIMTLLAFTASAHTAAPVRESALSVSSSASNSNTPNYTVPASDIVGYPAHYRPNTIYTSVGSPSFAIVNYTSFKQYVIYNRKIIATIRPNHYVLFNIYASGIYRLGLLSNRYAHLTVYAS